MSDHYQCLKYQTPIKIDENKFIFVPEYYIPELKICLPQCGYAFRSEKPNNTHIDTEKLDYASSSEDYTYQLETIYTTLPGWVVRDALRWLDLKDESEKIRSRISKAIKLHK